MGSLMKERFATLIDAINNSNEPHKNDDLQSVEDLIQDCGRYIESVNKMESAIAVARFRMEALVVPAPGEYVANVVVDDGLLVVNVPLSVRQVEQGLCN